MIDARVQIYEALKAVFDNVAMVFPEKELILPLVCYAEITNVHAGKWQDEIDYQIDVYAEDFEELVGLAQRADGIMSGLGFTRTYASPDTAARLDTGLYKKALNYHASVDTYHHNILTEE